MLLLQIIMGNLKMWQWILLIPILVFQTVLDIRTRRINVYICLAGILVSLIIRENIPGEDVMNILKDIIPGVVMMALSYVTKEKIGKGDAVLIIFVGCVVGLGATLTMLFVSLLLSAVSSLILLALKKVRKETEIPFAPFLSIGVLAGGLL